MPSDVRELDPVGPGPFDVAGRAARSALIGGAALPFAFVVMALVSVFLGDSSGVRAVALTSLAVGFALGARRPLGPAGWLRPALVGALAIACSALLPHVTQWAVAAGLPASIAGRALLAASIAFSTGAVTGLVFASSDSSASTRAAWFAGGGLGVMLVELVVSRRVGVQGVFFVIAFVALLPCVRWRFGRSRTRVDALPADDASTHALGAQALRARWLELGVGLTLGLFVEVARPIARNVLGPAHENWAALTSALALSIAVAALAGARLRITRARLLFHAALTSAAALPFATELFERTVRSWQATDDTGVRGAMKLAFLFVLVAPAVVSIGAAAFGAGRSPAVVPNVALGMVAGLLVARHALQPLVPLAILACAVSIAAAFAAFLATRSFQRAEAGLLLALAAVLAIGAARFPTRALADGTLDAAVLPSDDSTVLRTETLRRGGAELAVMRDSHGIARVRGDGHDDAVGEGGRAIGADLMSGVIPALYTASHARAFVLDGPGGTTAGASARLFERTVVVESNHAARDVLLRQSELNFDVARRPSVTVLTDADPFVTLAASSERFDAIVSATAALRDVAASKFATREFLALARSRLAPGGVVALSIDDRLPLSGLAIVLRTLSDAFNECHFVFLGSEHYDIICGDHLAPVAMSSRFPADILAALAPLAADLGVDRFLEALILVPGQFHGDWFPAANTFDLPVLDHVMAREDNRKNTWDLDLALRFDLGAATLAGGRFDGARIFERCFALGLIGGGETLPRCETMLRAAAGRTAGHRRFPLPLAFLDLSAGAAGRNVPSRLGGASLLDELVYAGQQDQARALIATRLHAGTLTATEAHYARRRGLMD